MDLKQRKRFPEVPDGRTQVQGDTLLCIKDTKFSFLLLIEVGEGAILSGFIPTLSRYLHVYDFLGGKSFFEGIFCCQNRLFIVHCAFSPFHYRLNCVSQFHYVWPQELDFNFFLMAVTQIAADNRNDMSNV